MNIGTLIAIAAKAAFEENELRLGVRLSPVTLTADELAAALQELRSRLGPRVYLVGSAPNAVAAELDPRAFVAPDQRAAERATLWRNRVRVADKERLVYVSVESHAKASGLRDCLEPLREQELRDAFRRWAESPRSGLPNGLAEALVQSELIGQVRVASLCEYASRVAGVAAGVKGAAAWQAASESLPLLNLVTDSKLGKADTADRLRANHAMVRMVETGEGRRRSASGPLAQVEEALQRALARSPRDGRRGALAAVDLGAVKTSHLAKGKVNKAKPTAAEAKPTKGEPKAAKRKEPSPPAEPAPVEEGAMANVAPDSPIERVLGGESDLGLVSPGSPEDAPSPSPRAVRLAGPPLPKGLAALLTKLLEGDGDPVEVIAVVADRSHLQQLATTLSPESRVTGRVRARLSERHAAWSSARRRLIEGVREVAGAASAAEVFTRGLAALLRLPALDEPLASFVASAVALYEAAGEVDERTMREVLSLDTLAIRASAGEVALRVIGPLHLLTIGQALVARRALDDAKALPENARRLIARALETAPAAPGVFPEETGEMPLARGVGGLLVYERTPELVSAADAAAAGRTVVRRYLELCPHALLGLRVAVTGEGDLTPLVEGVAAAVLEAQPRPVSVEVLCARTPNWVDRSALARALAEEVLSLGALDPQAAQAAHVTLRFAASQLRPEDDEAAAPAVKTFSPPGPGCTTFDLRAHGLRVRTSVAGAPELEAVESLVARSVGHLPQGAFVTDVAGRSLRPECEGMLADGGWLAIVGQSLGRRPPTPWFLLAHEGFGARATCAVVARDVRPAARSLEEGLSALGVRDMRPRALLLLAERLASAGRSSLVPLSRSAESLVVDGLLALELRRSLGADGDVLLAPITGAVYETLVGPGAGGADSLMLCAARSGDGLRVVVGYATAGTASDFGVGKTQFVGVGAKSLGRVLDAIQLAGAGARPDASAAREALSWALWGAVTSDDAAHGPWREVLNGWRGGFDSAEGLLLIPPRGEFIKERVGKVGRARVVARPLALERLNALLLEPR